MKTRLCAITLTIVVAAVILAAPHKATDRADKFLAEFLSRMRIKKVAVSEEQKEALRIAHPLLLTAADDEWVPMLFWQMVRQGDRKQIEWSEAKALILKGKIRHVLQSHSLDVDLVDRQGRTYTTKEPTIDEVLHVVKTVDPKKLFIVYDTE